MSCVNWPFSRNKAGYGRVVDPSTKKHYFVHRLAYEAAYGNVPSGHVIRHTCDNPSCFALEHLALGTQKENIQESYNKGRQVGNRKIPDDLVKSVLSRKGTNASIAAELGMTEASVQAIKSKRLHYVKRLLNNGL
jgi:hypothetical protein